MPNVFETTHLPRYKEEGSAYIVGIPEVKAILESDLFDSIQFVRERFIDGLILQLEYDVVAPGLMPHPRARLLEAALLKRRDLLSSSELPDGGVRQLVGFFGNKLQLVLNFKS